MPFGRRFNWHKLCLEMPISSWCDAAFRFDQLELNRVRQTFSGRGDKDVAELCEILPRWADEVRLLGREKARDLSLDDLSSSIGTCLFKKGVDRSCC
jgi:hypothetical protein